MKPLSTKLSIPITFEQRLLILSAVGALPASLLTIWLLIRHEYSYYLVALCTLFLIVGVSIIYYQLHAHLVGQIRTITNLLEALVNGDYSMRGRQQRHAGAVNELVAQVNGLADLLARQRFEVKESQLLLAKVISNVDVAVFTFTPQKKLSLANRAGAALYHQPVSELLGKSDTDLGLSGLFDKNGQVETLNFASTSSRFYVSTDRFIEEGASHTLVLLTNVQSMLRDEERKAWQDLIRVISHEINNSLSPIASLSQTLLSLPDAAKPVFQESLEVIKERADSLTAFIDSYRQLTKVPHPNKSTVSISAEIEQITRLYPQVSFHYRSDKTEIFADTSLLRQLLINLIKNAVEAVQSDPTSNAIINLFVDWHTTEKWFVLTLRDEGPGLQNPDNLFVPFYTTKNGGSGIGLLLCRQISEAHGGRLSLANHSQGGCEATLTLPV